MGMLLILLNCLGTGVVAVLLVLLGKKLLTSLESLTRASIEVAKSVKTIYQSNLDEIAKQAKLNVITSVDKTTPKDSAQETTPEPEEVGQVREPALASDIQDLIGIRDRAEDLAGKLTLVIESMSGCTEKEIEEIFTPEPENKYPGLPDAGPETEESAQAQEYTYCHLKGVHCPFLTSEGTCQGQCDALIINLSEAAQAQDTGESTTGPDGSGHSQDTGKDSTEKPQSSKSNKPPAKKTPPKKKKPAAKKK